MKPRTARAGFAATAAGDEPWLTGGPGRWILQVWVQPGAHRTGCAGVVEGRLKMRLAAPPVEGRANEALVAWVAAQLGLPRRDVELAAGATSRFKRLRVASPLARASLVERLLAGS
jgi:hypothetical protein